MLRLLPIVATAAMLSFAGPAGAQDYSTLRLGAIATAVSSLTESQRADVLNNFVSDTAQCLAYFDIVALGLRRRNDPSEGAVLLQYREVTAVLSREGLALSDPDVFATRFQFARTDMVENTLRGDFARFSVLVREYGELCKEHVEDPGARIAHWIVEKGYHR